MNGNKAVRPDVIIIEMLLAADEFGINEITEVINEQWQHCFNASKMKLLSVNYLKDAFLPPISMADINLHRTDFCTFLSLYFQLT